MSEKIKGVKGFDLNMRCLDMQYEFNSTATIEGTPKVCNHGLHFCEYPLDVFGYYPPALSRYAEVTGEGAISKEDGGDSKVAVNTLHIGVELSLSKLIEDAIKFTFDRAKWLKTNHATSTRGAASATGYQGAASATGYQGAAIISNEEGVAVSIGRNGKAKAKKGCFLVLAEWEQDAAYDWHRKAVQTILVDGETIKEDTFYTLTEGKFTETI